jgi:deoxyribodipyrimidine photo-lyase
MPNAPTEPLHCFWFRRDLRLEDNTGLAYALQSGQPVLPVFIFDRHILDHLPARDYRVIFLWRELERLQEALGPLGSAMIVRYGYPEQIWPALLAEHYIEAIHANKGYEPYDKRRDGQIAAMAREQGVAFYSYKDHVIFEEDELLTGQGKAYTVFTPYKKRWLKTMAPAEHLADAPSAAHFDGFWQNTRQRELPSLAEMGFRDDRQARYPARSITNEQLQQYEALRDWPAREGTSRLGMHLRFGTISLRRLARQAREHSGAYLNELIWRDFYHMIMDQFPHVVDSAFKPQFDNVPWRDDPASFERWCRGETGYPIVDAGMRQLNATGYMHNRLRMITASFLTKHLLIDWRWGEAYFGRLLLDYELSSNNGGWQWAAGSGCDAAPYFRIFNPARQVERFDPHHNFIQTWVPEYESFDYPAPIVDHKPARERALATYKQALAEAQAG